MINKDEVKRVANLARLRLSEEETTQYQQDLNQILQAADKLKLVDTEGIEPTAHAIPLRNVLRLDMTSESLGIDQVLKNGPEITKGYFRVPRIMEE